MTTTSLVGLAVGNLITLAGVVLWGWDASSILVMYWIETGVVGVINVLRISKAMRFGSALGDTRGTAGQPSWLLPAVWLVAYAGFWAILGITVVQVATGGFYEGASRTGWTGPSAAAVAWGTISLVAAQVGAYVLDYVFGRRYLTVTSLELLRDPFVRILAILATIVVGGVGIALAGPSVGFIAAMTVAKTAVELWFARTTPVVPAR